MEQEKKSLDRQEKVNRKKNSKFLLAPYIFIAPFFIFFIIFSAFPILYSFFLSFYSWNGIKEMSYRGIENYYFLIFKDHLFWRSVGQSLLLTIISGVPQHIAAISIAFILNEGLVRLKEFFKGVFFLPYITSTAAVAMIFFVLLGAEYGLINQFFHWLKDMGVLSLFGTINLPVYFFRKEMLWFSISIMVFWKWVGWNVIIYLAGIQTIPDDVKEAARIDGANNYQIFSKIIFPMLRPTLFFATMLTLVYGMQIFDEPVLMLGVEKVFTESYYTLTSVTYIYIFAFHWGKFGMAAATSYLLCLVILALSTAYRKLMRDGEV